MKINWFSPVPPARSSIANDTAAILSALARRSELTLWTDQRKWSRALRRHAEVRRYDPGAIPWRAIGEADVSIYHLGNEPNFHGAIWQASRQHPGVVVLHDLNLQHFFAGLLATSRISQSQYFHLMEAHHGKRGRELAEALVVGAVPQDDVAAECPLTNAAIGDAFGVVTHNEAAAAELARTTDVPVTYVPLFAVPITPSSRVQFWRRAAGTKPYRIVIFGYVGHNRRLDAVLRALHVFPGRDQFRLDVYGTVANERAVYKTVADLGLTSHVAFHGFVSDAVLDRALERSDLAINLRNPTMGEVSASQLRIWQHGLPSLVTDVGWYATLPRDTVATVRRAAEQDDILFHLGSFLADPEPYRQKGQNGRAYVNQHHTIEGYVDGMLGAARAAVGSRARAVVRRMSLRAGQAMRPWFTDEAADVLLPGVAHRIAEVFGERVSDFSAARTDRTQLSSKS